MRKVFPIWIALLAVAVPSAVAAQIAAPVVPAPTVDLADEVIAMMVPLEEIAQQTRQSAESSFGTSVQTNPILLQMEQKHPGVIAAVKKGLLAEMDSEIPFFIKALQNGAATLYRARLTGAELLTVRDFYSSPTGQHILAETRKAGMEKGITAGREAARQQANNGGKAVVIEESTVSAVRDEAAAAAMRTIRPEDISALTAFGSTSASAKLAGLTNEMTTLVSVETNKFIAVLQPKVMNRVQAIVRDHLQGRKGK